MIEPNIIIGLLYYKAVFNLHSFVFYLFTALYRYAKMKMICRKTMVRKDNQCKLMTHYVTVVHIFL